MDLKPKIKSNQNQIFGKDFESKEYKFYTERFKDKLCCKQNCSGNGLQSHFVPNAFNFGDKNTIFSEKKILIVKLCIFVLV